MKGAHRLRAVRFGHRSAARVQSRQISRVHFLLLCQDSSLACVRRPGSSCESGNCGAATHTKATRGQESSFRLPASGACRLLSPWRFGPKRLIPTACFSANLECWKMKYLENIWRLEGSDTCYYYYFFNGHVITLFKSKRMVVSE